MSKLSVVRQQQPLASTSEGEQLVTFFVGGQMFGISALRVRDVLRQQPLTRIPLAPHVIAGMMNLRGHIVTALDLRARLGLEPAEPGSRTMCVVVENGGDQFCLIVDSVGDVHSLPWAEIEANPASLADSWAELSKGIFRLEDRLLIILDIGRLLAF
jgi:purine-binding chemotaxis protein CheW